MERCGGHGFDSSLPLLAADDMEGFFLADNYDLSLPGDLAAYMAVNCLLILALVGLAAWFISGKHLDEEYRNFLSGGRRFGFWRGVFFLLPAVRVTAVELVNERIMLNNSNPVVLPVPASDRIRSP